MLHTTPLGTLIVSSPCVSCAWLRCWLAQLQFAGQSCNAHHTCTVPDPCNAELPICTRLCMGSINFCEFSFSYFDCLFLSSPRSSLRSFFFAAMAVAFSSASLALVSASSAMAPDQDHNSASPATLLPARHPPQATSLFLATVVGSTSPSGNVPVKLVHTGSLNCCILFTAPTRNTILHRPQKVPCCFVSNLWTRELWNDRLHRPSQLVHTLVLGINVLVSLETTLCASGTLDCSHTTHLSSRSEDVRGTLPRQHRALHLHQGLQARHLLLVEDLLLLPTLHLRIRASKVSFCTVQRHARLADASLLHPCSCWISHRRAFNSTMSVCKSFLCSTS